MQTSFSDDPSQQDGAMFSTLFSGQPRQQQQQQFFGSPFAPQQFQLPSSSNFHNPSINSIIASQGQLSQGMIQQSQSSFQFSTTNPSQEKSPLAIQTKSRPSPAPVPRGSPMASSYKSPGIASNGSFAGPSSASAPKSALEGPKSSADIINEFKMSLPMVNSGMGQNTMQGVNTNMTTSAPNMSTREGSTDSSFQEFKLSPSLPVQTNVRDKTAKKERTRGTLPRKDSMNITEAKNKIAALDSENAAMQSVFLETYIGNHGLESRCTKIRNQEC
jgi:hypothetical protein